MTDKPEDPFRHQLIDSLGIGRAGLLLSGCDRFNASPTFRSILSLGEDANYPAQRVIGRKAMAMEFSAKDLSPYFRPNGTTMPSDPIYQRHLASNFANWQLRVDDAGS